MLSEFITFLQEEALLRLSRDKLLLAVSGGLDSMTLLQLCQRARIQIGIAHCNFQLRGEESDQDAAFVQATAEQLGLPFYSVNFDTKQVAQEKGQSIQMAARVLRYEWLEKIRAEEGYQAIAVAHHQNDSIETILLNLTMGCGIRGLHGIYPRHGQLIRPLLFATRATIEAYAQEQGIAYREDSSNASTKYARNALRHQVIPALRQLNPLLEQTFEQNIQYFRETEKLYHYAIDQLRQAHTFEKEGRFWIDIEGVAQAPAPESFLYELLLPYHFKAKKINYIYRSRAQESGELYYSKTHVLLKNREHWIVQPLPDPNAPQEITVQLEGQEGSITVGQQQLTWNVIPKDSPILERQPHLAYLDVDKVPKQLTLCHWKGGEYFFPAGMGGKKKKLSKHFKDLKLTIFEKSETWLLCTPEQAIVWVVNQRADERFRATADSKAILLLEWK
jgi:tRNA(Ile)-lysidine synthase